MDFREDYMECLHHRKEGRRQQAIADEVERQREEAAKAAKSEKAIPKASD